LRLTPQGLEPGRKYVLHEPATRRVYGDEEGRVALTAADLAKGMLLHAGAMRYGFFVLEPYRTGVEYGAVVKPAQVTAAMNVRLPRIAEAMRDPGTSR
jgi:hypothetical protein